MITIQKRKRNNKHKCGCGEKGTQRTIDGITNWHSHCGNQRGESWKIKNRTTRWHSILTSGNEYNQRKQSITSKRYVHPSVHSSAAYRNLDGNNQRVSLREAVLCVHTHIYITMYIPYICTQWNIIQPSEKQRNPIICNMDSPWRHYAKWNKSNREKQILDDLT